jgi:hypothetical protein
MNKLIRSIAIVGILGTAIIATDVSAWTWGNGNNN